MRLTIGGVLIGVAVIAASFWVTLTVLDYFAGPPSPVVPSSAAPSAPAPVPAPSPSVAAPAPSPPAVAPAPSWNEALYLAINADVAAAVARREFKSGRE